MRTSTSPVVSTWVSANNMQWKHSSKLFNRALTWNNYAPPVSGTRLYMNQSTLESHTYTYTTIIFDVDISSLFNKVFHSVHFVYPNRYMQGSPLTRKKQIALEKINKVPKNLTSGVTDKSLKKYTNC